MKTTIGQLGSSSGRAGHSALRASRDIATTPSGPAILLTYVVANRSNCGSRPQEMASTIRGRQSPSHAGDEPDRYADRRRGDGGETAAQSRDDLRGRARRGLDEHDVRLRAPAISVASGATISTATPRRSSRRAAPSAGVIDADDRHTEVGAFGQRRLTTTRGDPTVSTRAETGERVAKTFGRRVVDDLLGELPGGARANPGWRGGGRTATTAGRTSGCARRGCGTAATSSLGAGPSLVRASAVSATTTAGSMSPLLATWRSRSIGCTGTSWPGGGGLPLDVAPLLLPSHLVAKDPPADLVLTPLGGEARPLSEWLTTFHLATVALDPYTNESAWILPTATRILEGLRGSDARVNLLVTAPEDDVRAFLGPLVRQFLVFVDDDRSAVKALGLEMLPAFVFIRVDSTVPAAAEGWNPAQWRDVAETIATITAWQPPDIPMIGDPGPFHGTPALAS